ncbi:serine hydrolase domain-containing protein [Lachnoclostridium phytofermentans]|uniref:Beta-lactamase n=1 Tax=Lachnoclostridium phytofermentans (strain ATCC 700394 / DSM 18823 / ISDg) TaxID=357809 RepID=A9KLC3_LACP7|nr:serine hydrolase [Lachnoclostridium phytofermentans]ABX41252.1 beta-lactamase [Lachnoclostridium phytofermentans ISDg]
MNTKCLEQLTEILESEVSSGKLKGCSLLVQHKNERVFQHSFGTDQCDSIYRIFSMTKPVTAIATMILYERGLLDLFDPISKYLKGFCNQTVLDTEGERPVKKEVTIQHLLNMTSGIVYPEKLYPAGAKFEELVEQFKKDNTHPTTIQISNLVGQAPLAFEPGQEWAYGASADVLGGIVETISGMRYGDFLKKEIFEPLGMKDTGFYLEDDKKERLVPMYKKDADGNLVEITKDDLTNHFVVNPDSKPSYELGGAGLYSTVEDYSKFAGMLLSYGTYKGVRILGRKTIEFISQNQLTSNQQKSIWFDSMYGYGYGNLMRIMMDQSLAGSNGSIGEYGWDGLPGTYFMVDPTEELTLIYMQQNLHGADQSLRRKMRQIVYGSLL